MYRSGEPLGARHAHVRLLQHVQHRRAERARVDGGAADAERDAGQDHIADRRAVVPADREERKGEGQVVEQHQPQPERRRRDAAERDEHGGAVEQGAAPVGRDDAGRQADQQLDQQAAHGQLGRHREARQDGRQHGHVLHVGVAEVAVQHVAHVARVLRPERQVEPQLVADAAHHVGRGPVAGNAPRRVARHQVGQREGDRDHPQQHHQQPEQASNEVADHKHWACG